MYLERELTNTRKVNRDIRIPEITNSQEVVYNSVDGGMGGGNIILGGVDNVVQKGFQNNYYMMNFNKVEETDINKYLTRNPANTRLDMIGKERNMDVRYFHKSQINLVGQSYKDMRTEDTRRGKSEINMNQYKPMAKNMGIPKDMI